MGIGGWRWGWCGCFLFVCISIHNLIGRVIHTTDMTAHTAIEIARATARTTTAATGGWEKGTGRTAEGNREWVQQPPFGFEFVGFVVIVVLVPVIVCLRIWLLFTSFAMVSLITTTISGFGRDCNTGCECHTAITCFTSVR